MKQRNKNNSHIDGANKVSKSRCSYGKLLQNTLPSAVFSLAPTDTSDIKSNPVVSLKNLLLIEKTVF